MTEVVVLIDHRDAASPPDGLEQAPRVPGGPADAASSGPGRRDWSTRLARLVGPGPGVLVMALGLLPMTVAAAQVRDAGGSTTGPSLWVLGLTMVFAPAALGVCWPDLRSSTRLVLAVAMAVLLPAGRLVVPGSSYRSGLEPLTSAVHSLSGLSAHASAVVMLLGAQLLLAMAVLLLITKLTSSVRIGSGAVVVVACQPGLLGLGSELSPSTLAVPLAVLALYLTYRRREGARFSFAPAMVAATTVSLTDHVTTALLVVTFATWYAAERLVCRRGEERSPGVMALFTALVLAATLLVPGGPGLVDPTRPAYRGLFGAAAPPWEKGLVVLSVVLTLTALALALWQARRLLRVRIGLALVLIGLAALYPLVLVAHLVDAPATVGDGLAAFVFLGVGFVVAWWVWQHEMRWWKAVVLAVGATVVFLGSTVLGAGSVSAQLVGPDRVSEAVRSPDADNLAAVEWLRSHVPAGSTVFADRTGGRVAAAYGGQKVAARLGSAAGAARLLRDSRLGRGDSALVQKQDISYLVVDRRAPSAPRKVTAASGVQVVYDNGSIVIYDLEALDGRR